MSLTATMKQFDPAVTSATGDLWLVSIDPTAIGGFAPLTLQPQTADINVTITPVGPSGTVVSGNLFVDDFVSAAAMSWQRFHTPTRSCHANIIQSCAARGALQPPRFPGSIGRVHGTCG